MGRKEYYTLVASLPALPYFERAQRLPINEVRLRKRMDMLEPEDLQIGKKIVEFISWNLQPVDRTDSDIVILYNELEKLTKHFPLIWKAIEDWMNQNTVLAALRRRKKGIGPPGRNEKWGEGPWHIHIIHNWNHPDFMLGAVFPWIAHVRLLFESGQALELQRFLTKENWKKADSVIQENPFAFEAIVAYFIKWGIIEYWLSFSSTAAGNRFDKLILEVTSGQEKLLNFA